MCKDSWNTINFLHSWYNLWINGKLCSCSCSIYTNVVSRLQFAQIVITIKGCYGLHLYSAVYWKCFTIYASHSHTHTRIAAGHQGAITRYQCLVQGHFDMWTEGCREPTANITVSQLRRIWHLNMCHLHSECVVILARHCQNKSQIREIISQSKLIMSIQMCLVPRQQLSSYSLQLSGEKNHRVYICGWM